MADPVLDLLIDIAKQIIVNQLNQATSGQQVSAQSFAQQSTNEILAGETQLYNQIQGVMDKLRQMDADLSNLISLCQQRGQVVTLPSTPPAGYGGASSGDNASAVWSFATGFPSGNALGALSEIRYGVVQRDDASGGYPLGNWPGWWIEGPFWNSVHVPNPGRNVIALDFATILPTDATPDAWVEREYPDSNWFTPFNGYPILLGDDSFRYFLPWLTQPEFDRIKAALFPSSVHVPPIWPGLAGVTLGTAVALDVGLTVTTPMQGCLIHLTSVPVKQGYFTFDDVKSYRNVGAVAFVSDDGQEEYPQTLGFESAVYCPKTMTTATAVKVRTAAGIVGTIRPFTIP